MEWTNLFQQHILARGHVYFSRGKVDPFIVTEDQIIATVEGTEKYSVVIDYGATRHHIGTMTCDCPYASSGEYCKHQAAVLYTFDDRKEFFANEKNIPAKDLVDQADEEYARYFLIKTLENNKILYDHFRYAVRHGMSKNAPKGIQYHKLIEKMKKKYPKKE